MKTIYTLSIIVFLLMNLSDSTLAQIPTNTSTLSSIVNNGALLVDVRTPQEFQAGSVKGAINIPLDQIPQQLSKFKNKKAIVVFCRSGSRSSQAKAILESNGIKNVINGGTWQQVSHLKK